MHHPSDPPINTSAVGGDRASGPGTRALEMPRFLMRQPLLDQDFRILGFELSINARMPLPLLPGAVSAEANRDELLLACVLDLEHQGALTHKLALLNLGAPDADSPLLDKLSRDNTVLALGQVEAPDTLAAGQELIRRGYALALDEATLSPDWLPLARQARYLRVDVGDNDLGTLCERLIRVEGIRGPWLIARDVATEEAFAACRKLSFQLYQGYYFAQIRPGEARAMDASRLAIMDLLNLVGSQADHADIEARFKRDAGLSYRVLRYINSPAVGLRNPIRSIGHALIMLGHDQLYRWLTLLLFAHRDSDGRAQALLQNALVRARLAESLGEPRLGRELRGGLFITGILSMLDSLLNLPMPRALAGLNLAKPITDALLSADGPYAPWLAIAQACEGNHPDRLTRLTAELDLPPEEVNLAHLQALSWAEGMDL